LVLPVPFASWTEMNVFLTMISQMEFKEGGIERMIVKSKYGMSITLPERTKDD
jgi:hypothetical protein